MFKSLALSGALAAGLMLSPAALTSASAAPIGKSPALGATTGNLILAGRGRGGGGFNVGGGGRSFGGGGRSFGGGGMGPRSFNRGGGFNVGPSVNRGNFGGGKWRPGGGGWGGKHHHHGHRHHRRFYGGGYYPYYGAAYYYGDSYGGYDCSWLRRKAVRTGSSYWWNRYEQCISDY